MWWTAQLCQVPRDKEPWFHPTLTEEKDAQEQGQEAGTMQLGMVGLCGAIAKETENPGDFSTHCRHLHKWTTSSWHGRLRVRTKHHDRDGSREIRAELRAKQCSSEDS